MADSSRITVDTVYGQMVVNPNDHPRGKSLAETGQAYDHEDIALLVDLVKKRGPESVVIDVGANCGSYALAMARHAAQVIAIEPQRELVQQLRDTIELNPFGHRIFAMHAAAGRGGDRFWEVPALDYTARHETDIVRLAAATDETPRARLVPETTVDHVVGILQLARVDILKIDAEGMDLDVLAGARETILRFKPILFVEWRHTDRFAMQRVLFEDFGYPSAQVIGGNDFLCDPDVVTPDPLHSYVPGDLPTLLMPEALATMEDLARSAPQGCFVEVGVYQGGSAQRLYRIAEAQERTLWLFDSFVGHVEASAVDWHPVGAFNAGGGPAARVVQETLPNAYIVMGRFPDVLAVKPVAFECLRDIAFAHLDVDQYESTRRAIRVLWSRLISGGIILIDDYDLDGCKLAVTTTCYEMGIGIEMTKEGKAVLRKP